MPGSDLDAPASSGSPWRVALLAGLAVLLACLGLVAGRVLWFDPYWVWRQTPPWLAETGGANRLIDRQTRRAKTLQALSRDYEIALVGSSTTYHGLDPADADPPFRGRIYNAGISGILAGELPAIAAIVASRPRARRVMIGLDYYMVSRTDRAVRLDPALETVLGRLGARLGSVIGRPFIEDAWPSEVAAKTDPGSWTYDGFRVTPPLSPDETRLNAAIRRRTTVGLVPATYAGLERALDILAGREVVLYLAPVNPAQSRLLDELGLLGDLERWRADMRRLAESRRLPFHDLTALGRDAPFDPDKGSTAAWLDNLHYTPVIGRRVLAALGLRAAP
ncbi:hypothetical protein [Enterovirga rhinocerotis]|uniref:Uncharacterized protein n=1 Tax=Enterovirga rhinocerotis TaxID=1339210 RepID=A0A4R7BVT5_9HYPH|nr:hypothetical protein [Enterovirga rhinocerotis]TDR89964.1 hypothetical protein EV668_2801 [Enterovirga rhinocerotis]